MRHLTNEPEVIRNWTEKQQVINDSLAPAWPSVKACWCSSARSDHVRWTKMQLVRLVYRQVGWQWCSQAKWRSSRRSVRSADEWWTRPQIEQGRQTWTHQTNWPESISYLTDQQSENTGIRIVVLVWRVCAYVWTGAWTIARVAILVSCEWVYAFSDIPSSKPWGIANIYTPRSDFLVPVPATAHQAFRNKKWIRIISVSIDVKLDRKTSCVRSV